MSKITYNCLNCGRLLESPLAMAGQIALCPQCCNASLDYNLGVAYGQGVGVAQDYAEAVKWYRKAAEQENVFLYQGVVLAHHNLGVCYLRGEGVPRDSVVAYKWLNLAARTNEEARNLRKSLTRLMTAEQIAEGQRLSREWLEAKGNSHDN